LSDKKPTPQEKPEHYHLDLSDLDRDPLDPKNQGPAAAKTGMHISEKLYDATEPMHALTVSITGPLAGIKGRKDILLEMINAAQDVYQRHLKAFDGGLTQKSPTLDVQQKFKK